MSTTSPNPWFDTIPGPRLKELVAERGPAFMERYGTDDVYFAMWMHALNRVVQNRVLISFDDLEDWDYWSAYDGGMKPYDAALEMLAYNGYEHLFEALS